MRILITRPTEDAARFAALLAQRGHQAVCASLLSVRFFAGPVLGLEGVHAILVTSANGVRALARRSTRRDLPVFAVGPQTEEAARLAGFCRIESADGDAAALAEAVPRWARPQDGVLFHAAGSSHGRLKSLLEAKGYEVKAAELYEIVAAQSLPDAARAALESEALDAVLAFSPRSAAALRDCIRCAGLAGVCNRLMAVCISQATAKALAPLRFRTIAVAARPNQDAMLDSLALLKAVC